VRGKFVALRYVLNQRQTSYRLAVVASRKVSKSAVVRNRLRRRIYEIVRKHAADITNPYDLIFTIYDERVSDMSHASLQEAVLDMLHRASVTGGQRSAEPEMHRGGARAASGPRDLPGGMI